jgi:adenylate cyclase
MGWRRPRRKRLALQVTLQVLIGTLLLVTVVAVGAVDFISSRQTVGDFEEQLLGASANAVAKDIEASFEPSLRALQELKGRAEYGRLPLDDRLQLGLVLADRMRYQYSINRLMYIDEATGGLTAAYRDSDARIIMGIMDPAADGGQLTEYRVRLEGTPTPHSQVLRPFDARQRTYYAPAVYASQLVWTGPEPAADGVPVMNASIAVRQPDAGALLGVLVAQTFVDELPSALRRALGQQPGLRGFLFTRQGQLLATSHLASPDEVAEVTAALPAPISDLSLNNPIPIHFQHDGVQSSGALQGFRTAGGLEWFTGFILPQATLLQAVYDRQRMALLAAGLFVLLGLGVGAFMASRVARPLRIIANDLVQVAQFHLSPGPAPQSVVHEVAIVSDAVDRMKASLRSFGRYVPADLVREMLARGQEAHLGGETRCLTIHFSDIESFTTLSEHLSPTDLVRHLAKYLECMSETIRDHQGTIDKFIGDGIMAFWNSPNDVPDHAAQACRAALRAQEQLSALRPQWEAAGQPAFKARIGLHTGEVIVGNFGTEERFAYTAMGDPVNLASRLEGQNKAYGTYICASQAVRDAAGPEFEWRRLDRVAVVGRSQGTDIYELLGERGTVAPEVLEARDRYEAALASYFARRFDEAAEGFRAAAEARPGDEAAAVMARRADNLAGYPPQAEWAGVFVSSSK